MVPGAKACGFFSQGSRFSIGPLPFMRLKRGRVVEPFDRSDLAADHSVKVGSDERGAAFLEFVADLAKRRVGLALFGVGRGQQREDLRTAASATTPAASPPGFSSPPAVAAGLASGSGRGLSLLVRRNTSTSARCLASGNPGNSAILVPGANAFGFSIMWLIFS